MKKHPLLMLLDQVGLDEFECNLSLLDRLKKEKDLSVLAFFFDRVFSEGFLPFFREDIHLDLQDSTYPSLMVVLMERIDGFSVDEGKRFFACLLNHDNVVDYFRFFFEREEQKPWYSSSSKNFEKFLLFFAKQEWLDCLLHQAPKLFRHLCFKLLEKRMKVDESNAPFFLAFRKMRTVGNGDMMILTHLTSRIVENWVEVENQLREQGYLKKLPKK